MWWVHRQAWIVNVLNCTVLYTVRKVLHPSLRARRCVRSAPTTCVPLAWTLQDRLFFLSMQKAKEGKRRGGRRGGGEEGDKGRRERMLLLLLLSTIPPSPSRATCSNQSALFPLSIPLGLPLRAACVPSPDALPLSFLLPQQCRSLCRRGGLRVTEAKTAGHRVPSANVRGRVCSLAPFPFPFSRSYSARMAHIFLAISGSW